MAGAYAALMSLMHTAELILHPSQQRLRMNRIQIESLLQKVRFLQEFLEHYSHRVHQEMAGLESQIADVANAAEDIIVSHVLNINLGGYLFFEEKICIRLNKYIQELIEVMKDLIKTKMMRIKETTGDFEEDHKFGDFPPFVSSTLAPNDLKLWTDSQQDNNQVAKS